MTISFIFGDTGVIPPALEKTEAFREASIDSDCATSDYPLTENEPYSPLIESFIEEDDNVADKSLEVNETTREFSEIELNIVCFAVDFCLTGEGIGEIELGVRNNELKYVVNRVPIY